VARRFITTVHTLTLHSCTNLFNIILPYKFLPNDTFFSRSPANVLYAFLISHVHTTCPTYPTLLGFMALIIFWEEHILYTTRPSFVNTTLTYPLLRPTSSLSNKILRTSANFIQSPMKYPHAVHLKVLSNWFSNFSTQSIPNQYCNEDIHL
jgi:hypothetical protein